MSELTGAALRATVQAVRCDETAADPGTDGQVHHVVRPASGTERVFAHGCRVGVVLKDDRDTQYRFDQMSEGRVPAAAIPAAAIVPSTDSTSSRAVSAIRSDRDSTLIRTGVRKTSFVIRPRGEVAIATRVEVPPTSTPTKNSRDFSPDAMGRQCNAGKARCRCLSALLE